MAVRMETRLLKPQGPLGTYNFDLAKEGSRIVNGARVAIRLYRCTECVKVMDRASHKLDVPCVIVVNGSFVERDPDLPLGTDHFCSQDAN
ncbi:hypothetical protein AAVH_17977 [Aphelenchoides avenae]|nr:hypothetical protein AAVH_17977 [Aphelenchus avenae]